MALLKPATTVCPGELSLRVLPQTLLPLSLLRPLIYELAAARKLILRQQKTVVLWHSLFGHENIPEIRKEEALGIA